MDAGGPAGSGPDGSATLADVLRQAGRTPPAAARPPPPRAVYRGGGEEGHEAARKELACDAKPVRDACHALAALPAEPPGALDLVVRLCGTALRDHPGLAEALVIRTLDPPGLHRGIHHGAIHRDGRPEVPHEGGGGGEDRPADAVLTIAEGSGSIRFGLELAPGSEGEGEAFLDRLRSLCLDPRRALL